MKNKKTFLLNPKYIIRITPYYGEDGKFIETKLTIVDERNDLHVGETPEQILLDIELLDNLDKGTE